MCGTEARHQRRPQAQQEAVTLVHQGRLAAAPLARNRSIQDLCEGPASGETAAGPPSASRSRNPATSLLRQPGQGLEDHGERRPLWPIT
jgi:hypothetical protein